MQLRTKDGREIKGTLEIIEAIAAIGSAERDADGKLILDFTGETDLLWDTQTTKTDAEGKELFVDEEGETWTEDGLELFDSVSEREEQQAEQERIANAVTVLQDLTEEQRLEVIRSFCKGCGSADVRCNCENDE